MMAFYFSATNDGKSIDIRVTTYQDFFTDNGEEYSEFFINELKNTDELNRLIGQTINEIKIAVYKDETILSDNFVIQKRKYAGLILTTDALKVSFNNNQGGYLWTDEIIQEFPHNDRWTWIETK